MRGRHDGAFHHKHSLGQNFIEDEALLEHLAAMSLVDAGDSVLEIGPGLGGLTRPLAARAKEVVSLEIDHTLIPILRVTLEKSPNAQVVEGDVMKTDLGALVRERFGEGCSLRVAANLPYYITTDVLTKLLRQLPQAKSIAVMIQKEVGDKLLSGPGEDGYGPLTILCRYHFDIRKALDVPAACFTPAPKVDSAFMVMERRLTPLCPVTDEALLWRLVRAAFAMRRKTLLNNLMGGMGMTREAAQDCLLRAGLGERARAEELSVEAFCTLCESIHSLK